MPQVSEPKAIRSSFFVLMLHGLSQPALADNSESLCRTEELKSIGIQADLCSCVVNGEGRLLTALSPFEAERVKGSWLKFQLLESAVYFLEREVEQPPSFFEFAGCHHFGGQFSTMRGHAPLMLP
jgi:hypothetical protein